MKTIKAFHTHVEVFPYNQGENPMIEKMLSVWDKPTYSWRQVGYYLHDRTLYLPRGVNLYLLEKKFNARVNIDLKIDGLERLNKNAEMTCQPRNKIQIDSINFLTGEEEFKYTRKYSQLSLNLDTGDGKTFCTAYSVVKMGYKAIVITHTDKIKQQWISTFESMTTIHSHRLIDIDGSHKMNDIMGKQLVGDVYFVNHQTLNSFAKREGWSAITDFFKQIRVGVKIYDEAHREFRNIVLVDMFSNVKKTIYLTANFNRSDTDENRIFARCFDSVCKFGEETIDYDGKRKHIVYMPVLYRSKPSMDDELSMKNAYGFSSTKFIEYAIKEHTILEKLEMILNKINKLEGRTLIVSPKIESTEVIRKFIENEMDLGKTVGTVHSKNSEDENARAMECDIISSTMASCGTGVDITGLRCLINLEPFVSNITVNQVSGRLREYSQTEDTYYFELVDLAIERCFEMYKIRTRFLKRKCKKIVIYNT